jgi:hypothetical protein
VRSLTPALVERVPGSAIQAWMYSDPEEVLTANGVPVEDLLLLLGPNTSMLE